MKFYEMYSKIVNKGCYELLPSERQAEINSFSYLIELLSNIKIEGYEEKIEMIKLDYMIRKIMGYKKEDNKVLAPTYELYRVILEFMDQSENVKKYYDSFDNISKNMSLDERLYYGLNITLEEYENQNSEIGKRLIR